MKTLVSLVAVSLFAVNAAWAAEEKPAAPKKPPTAQQVKMKECNAQAREKGFKKDERRAFMKECLSSKPAQTAQAAPQDKAK